MIDKSEIMDFSRELGLRAKVIEKNICSDGCWPGYSIIRLSDEILVLELVARDVHLPYSDLARNLILS